jgi:hypothetical protein
MKVKTFKGRAVMNSDDDEDIDDKEVGTSVTDANLRQEISEISDHAQTGNEISGVESTLEQAFDTKPQEMGLDADKIIVASYDEGQPLLAEPKSYSVNKLKMPSDHSLLNVLSGQFEALKAADAPKFPRSKYVDMEADEEDDNGLLITRNPNDVDEEAEAVLRNELNSFLTDMTDLIADEPLTDKAIRAEDIEKLYR